MDKANKKVSGEVYKVTDLSPKDWAKILEELDYRLQVIYESKDQKRWAEEKAHILEIKEKIGDSDEEERE